MLRSAFWLTALLFIPLGLLLYFLPPTLATLVGISPLWLARVMGGLLLAWGCFQIAASNKPDGAKVGGLAGGNLLTLATIVPALLRTGDSMPATLKTLLWLVSAVLLVAALLALLGYPEKKHE